MRHLPFTIAAAICVLVHCEPINARAASPGPQHVLEGTLRVHPKFHYRYYIDGFGDGQKCALFGADDQLQATKPGSLVRVRGQLASKFFGPRKPTPGTALLSTWIIYMDVDEVEVLRRAERLGDRPTKNWE